MSASGEIVVERIPDVVSVPLEAVFEVDGKPSSTWTTSSRATSRPGGAMTRRSRSSPACQGGETVLLVDPTLAKKGLPGDKATEPELNKGRSAQPPSSPAGAGASRAG